ncbi:MAG: protein translocase subunit SecF [Rhizobiales bacterium]|nr:protein translocase subunit SecF [Hyphomicrobiales bacterium]
MKLLRLAPETTNIPFMRFRRVSYPFSAFLSIAAVLLFLIAGLNFGIDFSGGTLIELRARQGAAELADLRTLGGKLNLGEVEVQSFGGAETSDVTFRFGTVAGGDAAQQAAVSRVRDAIGDRYEFRRVEVVGPRVSGELVQSGTLGVVVAIFGVLVYLWFRFEWQFAIAAIIATMHDLLLTVGFFALTRLEFNTTSIAAILTIVGVSLNETVIILDRIREMMRKFKRMPTDQLIDVSVNAVLPRTIMTATTTLLALLALSIFGGHVIRSFALSMTFGIIVATYSSVFICAPILIYLGLRTEGGAERESTAEEALAHEAQRAKAGASPA